MTPELLNTLFQEHYHGALFYALSLTGEKQSAEDLVQNAFYKALTKARNEEEQFKSWLFQVIRNEFLSAKRRLRFHAEMPEQMRDDGEELMERILQNEEYMALYRAISLLPKEQKELVTLFYFEELPIRSIAAIVKKSESYVKTCLFRARERLKLLLQEE